MNKVELLAPAGDFEKLKYAVLYGADAVYIGGQEYSLRANSLNFSIEEIKQAVDYCHIRNKKLYVAVNIVFHNEDLEGIKQYLLDLNKCNVDALIICDPLVLELSKEIIPNMELHLSTQQSVLNYENALFWKNEGVKRIVLGRELSKTEIKEIIDKTNIDIEVFIHGAMCVSYSGRCVLSNYFTNRDSNRGGCSQICRWNFDIYNDNNKLNDNTSFSIAVKDLSMSTKIKEMIDIGIKSLKVEGRMRSIYYISTVIYVYRKIIDSYYNNKEIDYNKLNYILERCSNRESTIHYFDKKPGVEEQYYIDRDEVTNKDFIGLVLDYNKETKEIILEQRNYFKKGDTVTIFGPNIDMFTFKIENIKDENDKEIDIVRHPKQIVKIQCNKVVNKDDIMRVSFNVDINQK